MGVFAGLLMLSILVVIHEYGHFIFAKIFKIGVPVFSVGMGPRLFGFRYKGTDYRLSLLPIGGYVQMSGTDSFGEEDADSEVSEELSFNNKPIWQRLIVMFAGPAFNLALPFVVFTVLYMMGQPQPAAEIGTVVSGSAAAQLGMEPGDVVSEVNGTSIDVWVDMLDAMEGITSETVGLTIDRSGEQHVVQLPMPRVNEHGYLDLQALGLRYERLSSRVGVTHPDSAAGIGGVKNGDAIVAVGDVSVENYDELIDALDAHEGSVSIEILRADDKRQVESISLTVTPVDYPHVLDADPYENRWGLAPAMLLIGATTDGLPAQTAGLLENDRLYSVDGEVIALWNDVVDYVGATVTERSKDVSPRALEISVVRAGELLSFTFAPEIIQEVNGGEVSYRPVMGVTSYPDAYAPGPEASKYYGFGEAFYLASTESLSIFRQIMNTVGGMLIGEISPRDSLGGPVAIFQMASEGWKRGLFDFSRLLATISISLGIINLFPVPVLDGGQIVFLSIEWIRGRPLSLALRERVQMVGVLALVALLIFVTANDIGRWWGG